MMGGTPSSRGRDTLLPAETWVTFDFTPGTVGRACPVAWYGDYSLVLVTPLGVTSGERGTGEETIGHVADAVLRQPGRHRRAREYLPEQLLATYDSPRGDDPSAAGIPRRTRW